MGDTNFILNLLLSLDCLYGTSILFRFYIGILSRKSEIFYDMFGLAPFQPTDSEKTIDGVPVVRLYDSAEDFAYLLSALLDYEYAA